MFANEKREYVNVRIKRILASLFEWEFISRDSLTIA